MMTLTDVLLDDVGNPVVGPQLQLVPDMAPRFTLISSVWTSQRDRAICATYQHGGIATMTDIPWPSESLPARLGFSLIRGDLAQWHGRIPEGVSSLSVHDLITGSYGWVLVHPARARFP